jgi:protein-disulfide isomerase
MTRCLSILVLAAALVRGEEPAASKATTETYDIVVFSDFQCPFCRQFAGPVRELMTKGVDGVKTNVTFKNFPLSFHPDAQLAAQAAMAAGEQGKFWEMHDLLFASQPAIRRADLLTYAERLGLDMGRFRKDLDSDRLKALIAQDQAEGTKLGVSGTPTFFINGKEHSGTMSFEQLKQFIGGEQKRAWATSEITDRLMSQGPENAPVTLEFFADLESPVSRPAMAVIQKMLDRYPSSVRLQFRNFPLAFHPQAPLAHEAALDAAKEGHFWEFAAYVLDHQNSIREQDLIRYAGELGLDETTFAERLHQRRYSARVDADLAEGAKRGIRGSPVIFVNGNRIDGVPGLDQITQYVEAELAKK